MRRALPTIFLLAMGGCAQEAPAPVPAPAIDARDQARVSAASLELLWGAEWDHPALARLGAPGKWLGVAFSGDGERIAVVRPRGPGADRMIAVVPTAEGPKDAKNTFVEAATADYVTMGSGSSVLVYDAKLWQFDLKSRALSEVLAVPDEEFLAARADARFALTFNREYRCFLRDLSGAAKQARTEGSPGRVAWDSLHDRVAIATQLFTAGGGSEGDQLLVYSADGERLHKRAIDRVVNALDFDLEARTVAYGDSAMRRLDFATGAVQVGAARRQEWFAHVDPVLALGHDGKVITFWDAKSLQPVNDFAPEAPFAPADGVGPDTILAAALSAPRHRLVIVSRRGLRLYRIRN